MIFNKKSFSEEEKKDQEKGQDELFTTLMAEPPRPELRMTGIYGDVTEDRCSEAVYGLMALHLTGTEKVLSDPEDEDSEIIETYQPIDFIISSHGGLAADMFSVYDVIRDLRDRTPIHTKGLGKVMSAGVLLLASGTKGERRIGKYCRVMIHGVMAGQHGYLADVENEFKETRAIQRMYVKALSDETNMSETYVRKLMNRKTNVYLDAEEAVKLGIADIIL
jgi:ATP-dependent Clp endopeptidase proteolytic subunit ClpP|tara:strand:+ start:761 stop:1423 length:663 start_codon:yes stop_codon:yes gene_type:complete